MEFNGKWLRLLQIEKEESSLVALLIFQSFFFGVFVTTFEIGSSAIFMETYGEAKIPIAYIVSGCVGVVFSLLFSSLQKRIAYKSLVNFNLVFVGISTLAMWGVLRYTDYSWIGFIVFIMMGPLHVVAFYLGFWGIVNRLFSLRQGKRLFGLIDSGLILGAVIFSFLIPLIVDFLPHVGDLLLISTVSVFVALGFQFSINKYSFQVNEEKTEKKKVEKVSFFKNKYVFFITLFMTLTTCGAFIIHFSFLVTVDIAYPDSVGFAKFFGLITGATMIIGLLLKTFLYGKLMNIYGLRVSLLLLPILVLFLAGVAILISMFSEVSAGSSGFVVFFLLISMVKLFSKSLRDAIEVPSFKLLYQPLPPSIRYNVQTKVDGVVNEFSGVLSGVVLMGLQALGIIEIEYYNYLVLAISFLSIIVLLRMYVEYKATLKETLEKYSEKAVAVANKVKDTFSVLKRAALNPVPDKAIKVLGIVSQIEPLLFDEEIDNLLKSTSIRVRTYAVAQIEEMRIYSAIEPLKKCLVTEKDEELKSKMAEVLDRMYLSREEAITYDYMENLVRSRQVSNRVYAAKVLGQFITKETLVLLIELLRDIEPKVRIAAINSAAKARNPELWPFLTNNLNSPVYRSASTTALVAIGEPVLKSLDRSFYKLGASVDTLVQIVQVIGVIGGEEAYDILLNKASHNDPSVVKAVLEALRYNPFSAQENKHERLIKIIEETLENMAWNIAAFTEFKKEQYPLFMEALLEENKINEERLFLLLSIVYDANSVESIKENLEFGGTESVSYAIELLDLFIHETLKPTLFPVLEEISDTDKVKVFENFYARPKYKTKELFAQVLNRDYNLVNQWTKACALEAMMQLNNIDYLEDYAANLFNPNLVLRQLAAQALFKLEQSSYHSVAQRLSPSEKRKLDTLVGAPSGQREISVFEKVKFLKQSVSFSDMKSNDLLKIANILSKVNLAKGDSCYHTKDSFTKDVFYIVYSGSMQLRVNNQNINTFEKLDVCGDVLMLDSDDSFDLIATEDTTLLAMSEEEFNGLMHSNYHFTEMIIGQLDKRYLYNDELSV